MSDQIPQLPVPSAEDAKKFKSSATSGGGTGGLNLPVPSASEIQKFKSTAAQKKNPIPTAGASASVVTKPSSVSNQPAKPAPSASSLATPKPVSVIPGKSQGKLLMAQPKKTAVEAALEASEAKRDVFSPNFYGGPATKKQPAQVPAPKKVGALEDIGNTFMSSVNSLASGIVGIPNMSQKLALMMATKMYGIDDEYNALPIEAKKNIDNIMSATSTGALPNANVSRAAQDYFIKKSDEFLEETNKSDKFLNERFGDFFKAPSVEKATDLFLEIPKGFAGSLPYMINPVVGAVSAASEQYNKDVQEAEGKLGWGQLINAGVTGVSEYFIEKISNGILNKSIKQAIGSPKVAKEMAEGFVKSVLKDVGIEFGGEGLTQFTQSLSNDITKGQEIDWVKTANQTLDAAIRGGGIAAGMRTTGAGVGYLAKKVMPNSEKQKLDRNTRAIMDLNKKKGSDNSPEVNSVINSKINELNDENKNIINSNIAKAKSLSDSQIQEVVKIDSDIQAIKSNRDAIVADPNLTDEEKQSLLDHLRSQAAALTERKTAVENQKPLTAESFPKPDQYGTVTFEFASEKDIPSELKGLTPTGRGSASDEKGNRKIFLSFSQEQINPIIDAIQKQTTSQVPVQPEAGTSLQVAEGEPQAEPQVPTQEGQGQEVAQPAGGMVQMAAGSIPSQQPTTTQEVKDEDVILSGLSGGFKAVTPNSFDPRSDEGVSEKIQGNKSFATTATIDGKKYAVVGLRLTQDVGAKTIGRDGYTFAAIEDNGNLPANVLDILTQKAIANTSSVYPNITNATIDSFKPVEVSEQMAQPTVQEGQVGEVTPIEEEFVYETNPENKEQWVGDFEIIDNRGGKADLEIIGREGNWYVANNVTGRLMMASSKSDAQNIINDADSYDFGQGETFTKQITNENIQAKKLRAEVATEETTQGTQPESGATEQPVQNIAKREEIKRSLEELKDVGILRSAITGKKGISQGEIDAQMALTDAMANVWKETTGRDDFYENFFNEVKQGDIDGLLEKGGVLFQNIELPQRPLTRVSLGVFDLPEFKKMEGKEVAINSIRDLARTRGKQIEKDLMQSVLEYDKYSNAKKISFNEFKSDVEMQVMKLEKIVTSSYASYGTDNLGDSDVYGDTNTIIYNSPIDHGEYGHFRGDFSPTAIMGGTMTGGFDMSWNDWEIRQIPGTDQYAAVDKSMPNNVTQDQLANYIGTAGTKEEVENWIKSRINHEGNINIGLFGHTRVWYDKGSPYYLAELQSDYFQKNDPNDLYADQVNHYDAAVNANKLYLKNYGSEELNKFENELKQYIELKESNVDNDPDSLKIEIYIKVPNEEKNTVELKKVGVWYYDKNADADQIVGKKLYAIKEVINVLNAVEPIPQDYKEAYSLAPSELARKGYVFQSRYGEDRKKKTEEYEKEYIKNEIEKIKNSEKGVSMLKQFTASQKIHEIRLLRESFRNAAQEGAETLRFPTPYTLAVIEGYVSKKGEAPYEIVEGNSDRLYQGDIINYGGTEMVVVDQNGLRIIVAPRDEVQIYDYNDYIDNETDYFTGEVKDSFKRSLNDINNITENDLLNNIDFDDLPWQAGLVIRDILKLSFRDSENESVKLSDIEDIISDSIRTRLYEQPIYDLFVGEEVYSDDETYYVVERRNQTETLNQPEEYDMGNANPDEYESNLGGAQKTVVNKYKELNKIFNKMRPDAEVVTDDNGMQWLETKLTPEDANNPVIAFQEEGGNIKGAVDFSNDNKASVYMFDGADISTLSHEMSGHLGRRFLEQLSSVDEGFAKDYETAKKWAGVKDGEWSIAAEEKWARGFERYLRDGKAPTKALKSVFDNLREWLKNIYKYIKGSSIDIKLTPEITKVFDNLLGARSEEVGIKELPGYARMMGEVDGIIEKSLNRGVPFNKTMDNAMQYMSKSKVYEDATDTQREQMVRDVRKMFDKKEKKAPTAQKILGQKPTKTTITVDESKELNKRLKALEAAEETGRKIGYKEGLKESEQARKGILDYVKSLKVNNKISGSQFKAIVNALKANLLNPVIRKRVEERIDKIIKKANYADQLERSNKLRAAIKKASKSKTLAANIAIMAKKFAKVNPNNVENLDEYIDMANLVYNSIGKPMRTIAEEAMVNEYSEMKIKEAQEAKSAGLEDLFNSLVKQGLIPKNLSLAEIQQYVLEEEQNKKVEESEQREKEKRDVLDIVFNALKDISNVMLNDGYNPFTGEDVTLSTEDRQLLKDFTSMDLSKLPISSGYRAQEALMNYIVNGRKFGMRGILARYQGAENVKVAVKKGLKAADFRWAVGGSWWGSRKWAKEVESIPGLFTWLFRGRTRGREVMKLMGLDEFMAGAAEAKIDRVSSENEYIAKFLNKKPNGKRFNNINNTYERLVYAYLSRSVDGSAEEKQAEFDRRKRILAQNVQAMEQSRNKDLIKEAQVLKRELNKAKDAKNADELNSKFDTINIQAVEFISGKFDEYFDKVDEVAEGIYNLILSKDDLYTPDMFRDISEKEINVAEMKESVDIPFDLLNKKPVGTMLENKRIPNLPGYDVKNNDASKVTKILKLDFDSSAFNALEKSLTDTYTAEAVQKYSAFVKSDEFSKLFDNVNDEKLFKEIVNYYINNERGKVGYKSDWKAVQNFSTRLKNFSTYRALGSATAFLKQSASAMINTSINLSNDPYALSQVTKAMLKDEAIGDFINRSRSEINLRGAEATADIKSAEKLIRESKYQGLTDVLDTIDKLGRFQMKSLSFGDVPMARASWFGYYVHALKIQGKPYKNIDWSKAKLDKDAATYANTEVSINQNASMPSTLGQLFSSKNPLTRLTATYLFPFTSFLFNAKSRLKTDITVLTSKLSTPEDKQAAGRSIVATLAEMPAYIAISTSINYALVGVANAFLGYDEDEEDEKLRLKRYSELAVTRIITDLLSPAPNVGDVATVAAFNALLEKMQEDPDMEEEEKKDVFKLFESKPESMLSAMTELLFQPISSTGRRTMDIYNTIDMAVGDVYVTDSGKEIEFLDEEKKMLKIAAAIQIMGSLNLLPSEAESLAKKMVKTIEKSAKEDVN
jgi:hypothetical protein